jgi:hypothetical protein
MCYETPRHSIRIIISQMLKNTHLHKNPGSNYNTYLYSEFYLTLHGYITPTL